MNRVIAVAGGSGSGKSTLAKALLAACGPERLAVLPIDAYYHDLSHLDAGAREEVNFDHPDALDLQLFSRHVEALRTGQSVDCPTYDFTTHCRQTATLTIAPRKTILVEGILVAAHSHLRSLYDELVFVDTPTDLRWERRLERDQRDRGRDRASIDVFWARAENTFAQWGSKALGAADLIIKGDQQPEQMVAELLAYTDLR